MKKLLISLLTVFSITYVQAWNYPAPQNLFEQPSYELPANFTDINPIQNFDFNVCTTFPRPIVGQKTEYLSKIPQKETLIVIKKVTEVTDTSLSENITTIGDNFYIYTNSKQNFTIKNHDGKSYKDVRTIINDGFIYSYKYSQSLTTQSIETHDGRNYFPLYSVCLGQNWDFYAHSYTIKSFVNGALIDSGNYYPWPYNEIKGVHVSKKVSAGTFDTFTHYTSGHKYGGLESITQWIDLQTGITVLEETRDSDGTLLSTLELQKIYP